MPYEIARRGLLDSHAVTGFAAFWVLVRGGHQPGECRQCLRWTDRNAALGRIVEEGAWWVVHRADEYTEGADPAPHDERNRDDVR